MSSVQKLRLLLDAGVPDSVAHVLAEDGHFVILHREVLPDKTPDDVVCRTALANEAILVVIDADFKQMAKRYGMSPKNTRFDRLSVIRLGCNETLAAKRLKQALTLIAHEWSFSEEKAARRLWVDVGAHYIRTNR